MLPGEADGGDGARSDRARPQDEQHAQQHAQPVAAAAFRSTAGATAVDRPARRSSERCLRDLRRHGTSEFVAWNGRPARVVFRACFAASRVVAFWPAPSLAAACGERSEPVGAAAELYPLTVTTEDRPLTIPAPAKRIVVLDGGAEAILEAIGAGDRVVGSSVKVEDLPELRPDLVVAPSGTDEQTLSQADAAGAPVYVTPDRRSRRSSGRSRSWA